jgi:hypothetical protein
VWGNRVFTAGESSGITSLYGQNQPENLGRSTELYCLDGAPDNWVKFTDTFSSFYGLGDDGILRVAGTNANGALGLGSDLTNSYHIINQTHPALYGEGISVLDFWATNLINNTVARTSSCWVQVDDNGVLKLYSFGWNSTGSIGTVSDVTKYGQEIEALISGSGTFVPRIIASDPDIEDPSAFALEEHLEAFLVKNWEKTPLAKDFAIFEEEGEQVGQQYSTDAGIIDILAVSRDKKRILIIELKRGRVSDVVVGQVLRYMGYVREQIAESNQTVEGVIIGLEDDQKLKWAISSVPSISFYRYKIDFKLEQS